MMNSHSTPIEHFLRWYQDAKAQNDSCLDAMALATATPDGKPSVRIVLYKGLSQDGFVFYTNYKSRKGHEIELNPMASILFHWPSLERQVRVEGELEKLTAEESDQYFKTRPRGSQLGAWASSQSQVLSERKEFEEKLKELTTRFQGKEIPRPDYWGGYRLKPESIELWQGKEDRLHERWVFKKQDRDWKMDLLFP